VALLVELLVLAVAVLPLLLLVAVAGLPLALFDEVLSTALGSEVRGKREGWVCGDNTEH